MTDITDFLRARLDEDQAAAKAMVHALAEAIAYALYPDQTVADDPELVEAYEPAAERALNDFGMDPNRVLAQVAAMRAIVDLHRPEGYYVYRDDGTLACDTCGDYTTAWPCPTLRHLAAIWRDHDDYDPAWAPEGE